MNEFTIRSSYGLTGDQPEAVVSLAEGVLRGDRYQTGINLSPFVIDHNALIFESGVKACFYRARALADEQLEFCFLEDNSLVNVAWKGILRAGSNFNELLFDPENQKAYNLDNVIAQFRDARKCILGSAISFDDL